MIRPNFTKMHIADLSSFESHFQDLLTALPPADPRSGLVEVDLQPLFFRMTLDSASEVLLGQAMSFRSQLDAPGSASLRFEDAFDYAQMKIHRRNVLDRGWMKPFGLAYRLLKGTKEDRFEESCETVHSILDEMIAEYLESLDQKPSAKVNEKEDEDQNRKYVFLEEMAKTTRNPLELRHEILNVLIAGRDTTATLLSNAFFVLARRPDIWARVRAEIDETFEGRLPEYSTLRNMKQVRNLLNECGCSSFSSLSSSLPPSLILVHYRVNGIHRSSSLSSRSLQLANRHRQHDITAGRRSGWTISGLHQGRPTS